MLYVNQDFIFKSHQVDDLALQFVQILSNAKTFFYWHNFYTLRVVRKKKTNFIRISTSHY